MLQPGRRRIAYTKHGLAEDPTGLHVIAPGNPHIWEVTGTFYREYPSAIMLRCRTFSRETSAEFCAASVEVLDRSWQIPIDESV